MIIDSFLQELGIRRLAYEDHNAIWVSIKNATDGTFRSVLTHKNLQSFYQDDLENRSLTHAAT
jgi:hypothetical protein